MLEEELRAFRQVVETEQELSSRRFTEEELHTRSAELLEQRQRAAEATSRRGEQSASGFDPGKRIAEIDEQTGWMSLMPEHLAQLQRERAILVEIRAIDEELSSANYPEHTLRQKLQTRDYWLNELHALYAEAA
jgi:hypothetical protein